MDKRIKWFLENMVFQLSDYKRDMPNLCPVYNICPHVKKGNCIGAVWCPVWNGGWGESHNSRGSEGRKVVDKDSIRMMNEILTEMEDENEE